jgi:hypothetical protein
MGSFQITYDDFSGGQYMGGKSTNLPKNTWHGNGVIAAPNGQLIATGSSKAAEKSYASGTTATIYDHWVVSNDSFVFIDTFKSPSSQSALVKTGNVNLGSIFPTTTTSYNLTGSLGGKVAFYPTTSLFYYISTAGNIYSVTTMGTVSGAISTALAGLGLTDIAGYGYRLVAWGGTNATAKKRLYYSDTTLASWSTANYYEFSGTILNVLPRTNDLLVVCDTGVFSLVGVLGSSVTNQLIVPQENVTEGMKDATIVGRNMHFLDQLANGSIDGRIYRLTGSTVQATDTLDVEDVAAQTGLEQARIMAVNDGRLVVMMRNDVCYAETSKGQWGRHTIGSGYTTNPYAAKQQQVGRPGPNSLNEFFMVASYSNSTPTLIIERFIHNAVVPTPTNADITTLGGGTGPSYPTGTVTLPEYWHSKPFTVKEMFIEYSIANDTSCTPSIYAQIIPTGNVDVLVTNISNLVATSEPNIAQANTEPNTNVFERFRPNNASKGFGAKAYLSFSAVTIKRVILNCED